MSSTHLVLALCVCAFLAAILILTKDSWGQLGVGCLMQTKTGRNIFSQQYLQTLRPQSS